MHTLQRAQKAASFEIMYDGAVSHKRISLKIIPCRLSAVNECDRFFRAHYVYNLSSVIIFDITVKSLSSCSKYKSFSIAVCAISKSIVLLTVIPFALH